MFVRFRAVSMMGFPAWTPMTGRFGQTGSGKTALHGVLLLGRTPCVWPCCRESWHAGIQLA